MITTKLSVGKTKDFDLTALRHHDLRKVSHPPAKKLKYYQPVIDIAVNKFYRNNQHFLELNMLDIDDLQTYGKVWTVSFIGLHELPTRGDDQNKKLLMNFLKQRFYDLNVALNKRHVTNYDFSPEPITTEEEHKTTKLNKKKAAELLNDALSKLDHNQMVEMLLTAANNKHIDFDAQKEASKRIHAHSLVCDKCKNLELPNVGFGDKTAYNNRPIVDETGTIYANPKVAAQELSLFSCNVKAVLNGQYQTTGGHTFKYAN